MDFKFIEPTAVAGPVARTFTPEFIAQFDQAWKFLKEHPGHKAEVLFATHDEKMKWFNTAKVYGAQHDDKVFVSMVKGSGSAEKTTGKLVFKMEAGSERAKRIDEAKKRADENAKLKAQGIEVKRGVKPATSKTTEKPAETKPVTPSVAPFSAPRTGDVKPVPVAPKPTPHHSK